MENTFINKLSSRSVSVRDISCYAIPRTKTLRGDGVGVSAFTLIELLIVVLIIGILAAISLPQYQVAVAKTRGLQGLTVAKAINDAEKRYYLANTAYTRNLEDLDIDFPDCTLTAGVYSCNKFTLSFPDYNSSVYVYVTNSIVLQYYFDQDIRYCIASSNINRQVCKSFGATPLEGVDGYYRLP